ncbi:MAG: hypothetical protein ACI39U_05400 [Candidatus Cryptobacteroides sp.]
MKGDIIDDYRRLPIGKYEEICRLCKDEELDELDRQVKIISVLSDLSEDEILNLPIVEYKEMAERTKFLNEMTERDAARVASSYNVGGFNLVPVTDVRKITTAQYIDFQEYAKGGDENLVEVLSCMLVPKGMKYNNGYDVVDVQRAIRENMSVADVLALTAFFLASYRKLTRDFLNYSKAEAVKIPDPENRMKILTRIQEQEEILRTAGVG